MLLRNHQPTKRSGFTLMEIIVVVAIILILAGAGIFVYTGVLADTRVNRAKMDVTSLEKAVETFKIKNKGNYPQTLDELTVRQQDGGAALLKVQALTDPWGNRYIYEPGNLHPDTGMPHIYSTGEPGKNQPISNWDTN
jgi:general secretion pathway protein G